VGVVLFTAVMTWATGEPIGGFAHIIFLLVFSIAVLFFVPLVAFTSPRRFLALSVSGAIILTLTVFILTSWRGLPASVWQSSPQSDCTFSRTVTSSITVTGFTTITNSSHFGSKCTTSFSYSFNPIGIPLDLLYWFLVSGLAVYAMPMWEDASRSPLARLSRTLLGSALAGALLLLFVSLPLASEYVIPLHYLAPLNPYVAYASCDSATFYTGTCVTVNYASYLVDYLFWAALVCLAAMTVNEVLSTREIGRRT